MPRIILHIDMNSYFASVEQQANPFLRGKPIGITGKRAAAGLPARSIVATASIEAKRLGVKTAMSTWEAKRVCPSLLLVAGDPAKYSDIMHRFNAIYRSFTDKVETFSVDESFLDVTDEAKDWFGAVVLAQAVRARLREELGECITASIGIAQNKLMAKIASERVKPNGLTVVKPGEETAMLDSCDLEDACGIGPRIRSRLEAMGITDFKRLRECPLERLVAEFQSYGRWLYDAARGIGDSELATEEEGAKSYGHSYTLPTDAWDERTMKRYLLGLCDKVAWRMRRDGCKAQCVSAYVRYGDPSTGSGLRFSGAGKQRRVRESVDDGLEIFKIAWSLIRHIRDPERGVRLLGVSASHLVFGADQQPLFKKERKLASVLPALDRIQHRYGAKSWTRASLLPVEIRARSSGFHFDQEL